MFPARGWLLCCIALPLVSVSIAQFSGDPGPSEVTLSKRIDFKDPEELIASDASLPAGGRLKLAIVIFRDAARMPLTDRYLDRSINWTFCSFQQRVQLKLKTPDGQSLAVRDRSDGSHKLLPGGCPVGVISEQGHQQAVAFGTWLRKRYLSQLPASVPVQTVVHSQSTHHNRSLVTLKGVLEGLASNPGSGTTSLQQQQQQKAQAAGTESGAMEWSVVVRPEREEIMYGNTKSCRLLALLLAEADRRTKSGMDDVEETRDMAQGVRMFMRLPSHDSHGWISWKRLLDAVMCLEHHKQPLYPGMSNHMYRTIDREATLRVAQVLSPQCKGTNTSACRQLLQLSSGRLLSEIASFLNASAASAAAAAVEAASEPTLMTAGNTPPPRLVLMSAHDSTLMPLLAVLGSPVQEWPAFMSSLVLELWQTSQGPGPAQHAVRVLYNMKPLTLGKAMDGTGTPSKLLPLEQLFSSHLTPFVIGPEAYQTACASSKESKGLLVGQVVGTDSL